MHGGSCRAFAGGERNICHLYRISHRRGPGARRRRRLLHGRSRRDRGHRGRERLGQIGRRDVDPAPDSRSAGTDHRRARSCSTAATCWACPRRRCAQVRGSEIGMVFQEPMTSLNPVLTIGRQITETLEQHRGADRATADQRARRAARPGRHRRSRAPAAAVSAPAFRRHAPARHDRHRARLRAPS